MDYIKYIKNLKYTQGQIKEILTGFDNGLSVSDISIYADPSISKGRMAQIRLGLEYGLGDKVNIYSNILFNAKQMKSIRYLLMLGIKDSDIKYLSSEYNHKQLLILGLALITGIDKDWALGFIKYEDAYSEMFSIFSNYIYNNKIKFIPESIYYNFSNEFYAQSIKILLENNISSIR